MAACFDVVFHSNLVLVELYIHERSILRVRPPLYKGHPVNQGQGLKAPSMFCKNKSPSQYKGHLLGMASFWRSLGWRTFTVLLYII